jgi:hypothetical protein
MTTTETNFDLNKADSFEVIPENTVCTLQLKIRAGGAGGANDDGWSKCSADGASEHIDCEYRVIDGDYKGKKLWEARTIRGKLPKHQDAGVFTMRFFRALFESAKGIRPDDKGEAAEAARKSVKGWADFNGLCFMARLGVRPPEGTFPAKNTILEVITPERMEWQQPEQLPPTASRGTAAAAAAPSPAPAPTTPPANAITRPQWAGE